MLLTEGRRVSRASTFAEVSLLPKTGSSIDQMLEYLAEGAPTLGDLAGSGQATSGVLVRFLRRELPGPQARRLISRIEGRNLQVIGMEEGVSKQAVHKSLVKALASLAENERFLILLCDLFPESGLTPGLLMEAVSHDR